LVKVYNKSADEKKKKKANTSFRFAQDTTGQSILLIFIIHKNGFSLSVGTSPGFVV